jgi:hypothetical protein
MPQKYNYNLKAGTPYQIWTASTIEWVAAKKKYMARAMVEHKTTKDKVAFYSWHVDFADAERAIDLLVDSLSGVGKRRVYNIYGEVTDEHTTDGGGGTLVKVSEVLVLIWSMQGAL